MTGAAATSAEVTPLNATGCDMGPHRRRVKPVFLGMLLVAGSLLLAASNAFSMSEGIVGQNGGPNATTPGATCHSPTPTPTVIPLLRLEGSLSLPLTYEPNKEYHLLIVILGGPAPNGTAYGGFNLRATAGTLAPNGTDTQAMLNPTTGETELTHTTTGNDQRSWVVKWTSPAENKSTVYFYLVVNAVNGDGLNSPLDQWNAIRAFMLGTSGEAGGGAIEDVGVPVRAYWIGVIGFAATLVVIFVSYFVMRGGSRYYKDGKK